MGGIAVDLTDREVSRVECDQCAREYDRVVVVVSRDSDAYAVVSASFHGHADREAWMDVTLGSWTEPFTDHVTISCRVSSSGASVVDAIVASRGDATY
jgi:hypothetical protein